MHIAASTGNVDIAQLPIENGANVNHSGFDGNSAPIGAQNAQWIIDLAVDINYNKYTQDSPLHVATFTGNFLITRLLLKNGANIEALGVAQDTALQLAVVNKHWSVVEELLAQEAGQYD